MKKLNKLQISINLLSLLTAIYFAWQAVLFCNGEVSIPWVIKPEGHDPFWIINISLYYFAGVYLCLGTSVFSLVVGHAAAKVAVVGWRQFFKEEEENAARAKP